MSCFIFNGVEYYNGTPEYVKYFCANEYIRDLDEIRKRQQPNHRIEHDSYVARHASAAVREPDANLSEEAFTERLDDLYFREPDEANGELLYIYHENQILLVQQVIAELEHLINNKKDDALIANESFADVETYLRLIKMSKMVVDIIQQDRRDSRVPGKMTQIMSHMCEQQRRNEAQLANVAIFGDEFYPQVQAIYDHFEERIDSLSLRSDNKRFDDVPLYLVKLKIDHVHQIKIDIARELASAADGRIDQMFQVLRDKCSRAFDQLQKVYVMQSYRRRRHVEMYARFAMPSKLRQK